MPDRLTTRATVMLVVLAFGLTFAVRALVSGGSSAAVPPAKQDARTLVAEAPDAEPDLQLGAATVPALQDARKPPKRRVRARKPKRRVVRAPRVQPRPVMPAATAQPAPAAVPRSVAPVPAPVPAPAPQRFTPAPQPRPPAPRPTPAPTSGPPTSGVFDTTGEP